MSHTLSAVRDSKDPNGPTLDAPVHDLLVAIKADQVQH
ncbi:MAG TPA: DUF397 domain-containing protein [Pseudonocardiaceae bacterium]|nr:DUF397 domain-containing protein [Pseudonocardiaceae bacterium]